MKKFIFIILSVLALASCTENYYFGDVNSDPTIAAASVSYPVPVLYSNGHASLILNEESFSFSKGVSVIFYETYIEMRATDIDDNDVYVTVKKSDCETYSVWTTKGFGSIKNGTANVYYSAQSINTNVHFDTFNITGINDSDEFRYNLHDSDITFSFSAYAGRSFDSDVDDPGQYKLDPDDEAKKRALENMYSVAHIEWEE